jgi:hypothetical protein
MLSLISNTIEPKIAYFLLSGDEKRTIQLEANKHFKQTFMYYHQYGTCAFNSNGYIIYQFPINIPYINNRRVKKTFTINIYCQFYSNKLIIGFERLHCRDNPGQYRIKKICDRLGFSERRIVYDESNAKYGLERFKQLVNVLQRNCGAGYEKLVEETA